MRRWRRGPASGHRARARDCGRHRRDARVASRRIARLDRISPRSRLDAGRQRPLQRTVGTQTSVLSTVRSGSYFARVRARTPGDSSVLSNEVWFAVGESSCTAMPKTPREPSGSIAAGVATLRWKQAGGATSFIVQAGTAPGRSDLFNGNVGSTRTVSANAPADLPIYARVIAVNACGQSAASAEVRIQ